LPWRVEYPFRYVIVDEIGEEVIVTGDKPGYELGLDVRKERGCD
jgi:hypothetical protein